MSDSPHKRNLSTALSLVALVAGMLMLTAASVPLYRLFCQVTGFGGMPQRASDAQAAKEILPSGRFFTVRYNADTDPGLPWKFRAADKPVRLQAGQRHLAHYEARNLAGHSTAGTAIFNVTPLTAAPYFVKIHCFCFEEQRLAPHQRADMPVSFYIDPKIAQDPGLKDLDTITLSYTFFPLKPKR